MKRSLGSLPVALTALVLLASACGGSAQAEGPPDINYGRDICFECNMIISEARFASAYRLPDGTEKIFDDIGGMLKHGHSTGEISTATAWVHDYETEAWVPAEQAYFIITQTVATPMAFGIISLDDAGRASAFATDVDADVVDWEMVLKLPPGDLLTITGAHDHDESDGGDMDGMESGEMDGMKMDNTEEGAPTS